MRDKKIFVLKIVWRKSIASLHRLTQAVQQANLRRTAGDPTWVYGINVYKKFIFLTTYPPPLVNVVCEGPLIVDKTNFGPQR